MFINNYNIYESFYENNLTDQGNKLTDYFKDKTKNNTVKKVINKIIYFLYNINDSVKKQKFNIIVSTKNNVNEKNFGELLGLFLVEISLVNLLNDLVKSKNNNISFENVRKLIYDKMLKIGIRIANNSKVINKLFMEDITLNPEKIQYEIFWDNIIYQLNKYIDELDQINGVNKLNINLRLDYRINLQNLKNKEVSIFLWL